MLARYLTTQPMLALDPRALGPNCHHGIR